MLLGMELIDSRGSPLGWGRMWAQFQARFARGSSPLIRQTLCHGGSRQSGCSPAFSVVRHP